MFSYKEILLILILTVFIMYGFTMCYTQVSNNAELEENIAISEKKLSEIIRKYDNEIKGVKESKKSCKEELQARKEYVAKCRDSIETQKSWLDTLKKRQKEADACILKRGKLKAQYKDCTSDDTDIFKNGNEANKVKNFVLFIGYPRSGHSIVGALLDAHPHVVISHELCVLQTWRTSRKEKKKYSKYDMFKEILKNTEKTLKGHGFRSMNLTRKYYTLNVPGLYQGKYENYIQVIGDKKGGSLITIEKLKIEEIIAEIENFQKFEGYPLRLFHIVRNPYDNIATRFLYGNSTAVRKDTYVNNKVWNDTKGLSVWVRKQLWSYNRIQQLIEYFGDRVLTLHHEDLINDSKTFLNKMCDFLEIQCDNFYIETAAKSVFSNVTKSRQNVVWNTDLSTQVESAIENYPFLKRYTFED